MSLLIKNISKEFITKHNKIHTLEKINLQVEKGEFVCIVGPSGCGKTTLLNIIAGLEKVSEGNVLLSGKEIIKPGTDRAIIFQEPALFPWLRVIDNVEFGMKMAGFHKEVRREKALKYLKMVHLTKFQDSFIHELSGGMKQRVALARALTLDSEILLMDEPFAALDSRTKEVLQLELLQIWQETGKTIIFVTHNLEEAVYLADRVIFMTALPGRIKKEFVIDIARPRQSGSRELNDLARDMFSELREEVGRLEELQYGNAEDVGESTVLRGVNNNMGIDL